MALRLEKAVVRPCIRGREIRRYWLDETAEVLIYPYKLQGERTVAMTEHDLRRLSHAWSYLESKKDQLRGRSYFEASSRNWFELWCQRDMKQQGSLKIIVPELAETNRFALAPEGSFYGDTVCGITLKETTKESLNYILGVLNSRLAEFYYKQTTVPKANQFYIYKTMFLKRIPIRRIDFNDVTDKTWHDDVIALVERMLKLHKNLPKAKTSHEKTAIERQIQATDKQIDDLVYELYGLTEKEIRIVEGR